MQQAILGKYKVKSHATLSHAAFVFGHYIDLHYSKVKCGLNLLSLI